MKTTLIAILTASACLAPASSVFAHGGGLNAQGCHNDRKNGGYHCHRSQPKTTPQPKATTVPMYTIPKSSTPIANPFNTDRLDTVKAPQTEESVPMSVCQEIFKTDQKWMDDPAKRATVAKCK